MSFYLTNLLVHWTVVKPRVLANVVGSIMVSLALAAAASAQEQQTSVIVQPGAPGQPTRVLPANSRARLPESSKKDVEFMQGMIMHHAQAVEMTALIADRTDNKPLALLGARISQSQSDEMNFMKRWLINRGESTEMQMPAMKMDDMPGMKMSGHDHSGHNMKGDQMMMPGMLTPKQMAALKAARGAEFDRLFLTGMIQHHGGALTMVKDLFAVGGAGQEAELFNFVTDVDSGQRAEIRIMQNLLGDKKQ